MTVKAISAVKLPDGRVEVTFDDGDPKFYYRPTDGAVINDAGVMLAVCGRLVVFGSMYVTLHQVLVTFSQDPAGKSATDLVQVLADNVLSRAGRTKHVENFVWEGKPAPGTPCEVPDEVIALWAAEATLTL